MERVENRYSQTFSLPEGETNRKVTKSKDFLGGFILQLHQRIILAEIVYVQNGTPRTMKSHVKKERGNIKDRLLRQLTCGGVELL